MDIRFFVFFFVMCLKNQICKVGLGHPRGSSPIAKGSKSRGPKRTHKQESGPIYSKRVVSCSLKDFQQAVAWQVAAPMMKTTDQKKNSASFGGPVERLLTIQPQTWAFRRLGTNGD